MLQPIVVTASEGDEGAATRRLQLRLPSDVACIEDAVALVERHTFDGAASTRTRFRLQVALAEALANAILRGNRADPGKAVTVDCVTAGEAVRVTVTDEGEGFDPSQIPDPCAPERILRAHGRGLFIIRHMVDAVDFNDRGNAICMTWRRQ